MTSAKSPLDGKQHQAHQTGDSWNRQCDQFGGAHGIELATMCSSEAKPNSGTTAAG